MHTAQRGRRKTEEKHIKHKGDKHQSKKETPKREIGGIRDRCRRHTGRSTRQASKTNKQ